VSKGIRGTSTTRSQQLIASPLQMHAGGWRVATRGTTSLMQRLMTNREASDNSYGYDCNNNGLSNGNTVIVARIMVMHVPSLYFLMRCYQRGL
jgi:hypothetical protein